VDGLYCAYHWCEWQGQQPRDGTLLRPTPAARRYGDDAERARRYQRRWRIVGATLMVVAILASMWWAWTARLQAEEAQRRLRAVEAQVVQATVSDGDLRLLRVLAQEREEYARMLSDAERGKLPPLMGMGVRK